ncbi:uncharacterized protein, partial [Paramormyrops kingsleyae]|uniref:uncharacterized protein n=1 Tax=Paramormyrops kingsleyae TaxID=1676925 RepID=UPI003B96D360
MSETKSVSSRSSTKSSKDSQRSSSGQTAIQARAKAEALRARAAYAQREIEVKVKQAQLKVEETRLEATLEALRHEREAEVAIAEAFVFETAADVANSEQLSQVSTHHAASINSSENTRRYVQDQMDFVKANQSASQKCNSQVDFMYTPSCVKRNDQPYCFSPVMNMPPQCTPHQQSMPWEDIVKLGEKTEVDRGTINSPVYKSARSFLPTHHRDTLPAGERSKISAVYPSESSVIDLARFLARRDLLTGGLTRFDDKPEHYLSWKSTFHNAIEGLQLKPSEELDLLIKWLGPDSAEHVRRVRSVHIRYPGIALNRVWERLEECYASAEAIEAPLFQKLEGFPKISNREPQRLRDLGDLLHELESAKAEGYLPGLSYLDTARGISPILEKLPVSLQEKWILTGSRYKQKHRVGFPPFSFFSSFVRTEARIRNDPSFQMVTTSAPPMRANKPLKGPAHASIVVHKTEVGSLMKGNDIVKNTEDLNKNCPLHKKPHPLRKCRGFRGKSLEQRKAFLKENSICFRCCSSTSHKAKDCRAAIQCSECDSNRHIAALHDGPAPWLSKEIVNPSTSHGGEEDQTSATSHATTTCTEVCGNGLSGRSCSKICLVNIYLEGQPERKIKAYVILDDQSNKSLARSTLFDMFGITDYASSYTLKTCSGVSDVIGRRAKGLVVESIDRKTCLSLPTLLECDELPDNRAEIPTPDAAAHQPHLKALASMIPAMDPNAQILILLGRDIIQVHKVLEQRNGPLGAPFAQRLALGWVIIGDVCLRGAHKPTSVHTFKTNILENGRPSCMTPCSSSMHIKEGYNSPPNLFPLHRKQQWAPAMLKDSTSDHIFYYTKDDDKLAPSMEDLAFLRIMEKEFHQDNVNSWVAPLPFRSPRQRLPNNRGQAEDRLKSLTRRLRRHPEMKEHFVEFMGKVFENAHAEIAPPVQPEDECWYLPIFGVYHPQKPGQIRVVFDSSAQYCGVSLNDILLTGPNMNNSLVGVLMRFRRELVAVTADVQQMFHCFVVREDHRNFLRFLWYRDNIFDDEVVEYRMCVHVFGNSPSPAVAMFGLRKAALHGESGCGWEARHFVERNFYVDDGLTSVPTEQQAIALLHNTQRMLSLSNLRLHKIASNKPGVMRAFPLEDLAKGLKDLDREKEPSPMQRSLGVSWDIDRDLFTFRVSVTGKPYTRRGVLSTINSLFDPLGFVAPVSIQGRSLLRELTLQSCDWDAPLPEDKYNRWKTWEDSLSALEQVEVPRQYTPASISQAYKREMHVFCDASIKAIAAVAYLRTINSNQIAKVGFIFGRTKLAPRPEITVPRLELCAAVLAVEVADAVIDEMDIRFDAVIFYSDSRVVLGYIHNESRRFYVYVNNRVQRIRKSTTPDQWRYVRSDRNPADEAT